MRRREIPIGQFGHEPRATREGLVGHHQAPRKGSIVVFKPQLQIKIGLNKEEMLAADAVNYSRAYLASGGHAIEERFVRVAAQEIDERQVQSESRLRGIQHLVQFIGYRNADILSAVCGINNEYLSIIVHLCPAVVPCHVDEEPIGPSNDENRVMRYMQKFTIR